MTAAEIVPIIGAGAAAFVAVWHKINTAIGTRSKDDGGSVRDLVLKIDGKVDAIRSDVEQVKKRLAIVEHDHEQEQKAAE